MKSGYMVCEKFGELAPKLTYFYPKKEVKEKANVCLWCYDKTLKQKAEKLNRVEK